MKLRILRTVIGLVLVFSLSPNAKTLVAQTQPPVRALGAPTGVTRDSLKSAITVIHFANGRVLVHDLRARRVVLFDSSLSNVIPVVDTTSATSNAYGTQNGTLIPFRGDSALYIDQSSLSMLVISSTGKISRVMAIPRPNDAMYLGGYRDYGVPGFDAIGRMMYYTPTAGRGGGNGYSTWGFKGENKMPKPGDAEAERVLAHPDTAFIVRVDLSKRTVDTLTVYHTSHIRNKLVADAQNFVVAVEATKDPLPLTDEWTVLRDGTLAILRGRDFHVDYMSSDGKWTSSPKVAFEWQRLSDVQKQALIDSSARAESAMMERMNGNSSSGGGGGGGSGGRGGGGVAGAATGVRSGVRVMTPHVAGKAALNDIPDFVPPIEASLPTPAVLSDYENNLWIRTTTRLKGEPVIDIVNRRGELIDRVQIPSNTTIAGFGPGVVYLSVLDQGSVARLERVKVR